jgi:hypothetical protein
MQIKKAVILFIFSFLVSKAFAENDLHKLRQLFYLSLENNSASKEFLHETATIQQSSAPVLIGFKALSHFMYCKYLLNPFSKLSHFTEGKNLLEYAIHKSPDNIELIYFRFTIQTNVPSLLGYSSDIVQDKKCLMTYLKRSGTDKNKDMDLCRNVYRYLLQSSYCSKSEKKELENLSNFIALNKTAYACLVS